MSTVEPVDHNYAHLSPIKPHKNPIQPRRCVYWVLPDTVVVIISPILVAQVLQTCPAFIGF